jgi:glycerol-3-phosphate dehydrogenase
MNRASRKTGRLGEDAGGEYGMEMTTIGAGDFVATCGLPLSRDRVLGRIVAYYWRGNEQVPCIREDFG